MRCINQFSPVRMRANRTLPPNPPSADPCSTAMTSPSFHFSSVYVPWSQMLTCPAPYSPFGMVPSNVAYSIGWSSVGTARWLRLGSVGGPFGTAHETSTPSRSSRTS